MVKGLYTAHTGMVNEMKRLDIMTNNLANANTVGYKKEGTTSRAFAEEYAIRIRDTSTNGVPRRLGEVALGTHLGQVYTDYAQGNFRVTDISSDLALDGNGFFAVSFTDKQGNTSVKYTRDGSFTVNTDGYLVTKDGDYVLNATGALNGDPDPANYIRIDPLQDFAVNELGFIIQNNQIVGTVGIADIDNYDYIEKYGENLYNFLDGANVIASDASIRQGVLETSNVNVINEMVTMIAIQRAYDAGQKVITSIDGDLDIAANQLGKL